MQQDNEPSTVTPEKSLIDYFYLFVERLWLIIIFLIIGLVFAHREVSKIPTTYRSSATIEVKNITQIAGEAIARTQQIRHNITATTAQKLSLNSLYFRVVDNPEFRKHYRLVGGVANDVNRSRLFQMVRDSTNVNMRPMSSPLIDIYVTHTDAEFARDVIAIMLKEHKQQIESKKSGSSENVLKVLQQQIDDSREKLTTSEKSLVIYNRALEFRDEIRESDNKILEMEKKYLPKWPDLVDEKELRASRVASFNDEISRILSQQNSESEFWKDEEMKAGIESFDPERKLKWKLRTAEARNNMLNRDNQTEKVVLDTLLKKFRDIDDRESFGVEEIEILEHPKLAKAPVRVNKASIYMKFGMLGAALGAGISFLLGSLDSRVRRIEDLEKISNTKVLSAVPKSGKLSKGLIKDDQNVEYESIRTLHTNVLLNAPDAKTILITSSTPSEGKSTISCNLAAASASCGWGEKVLLIDFDLRKARVHQYMGLADDTKGVGDYLINKDSINECIAKHPDVPDLYVMVGGSVRFEGSLPDLKDLEKMLDLLKNNFDRIIIDSAPILAVSDTLVLSQFVDELIVVFRMWKTPRKALIRTLMQLSENGTYPFGVVANYMPQRGLGRHAYYYSYAGTGYKDYSSGSAKKSKPKPKAKAES